MLHWLHDSGIADVISIGLAIVVLVIAWYEIHKVHEISHELSTRFIGTFEARMDEVIRLVKSTKKRLRIACDVAAYGQYSSPRRGQDYETELRERLNNAQVDLVVYDAARLAEVRKHAPAWNDLKAASKAPEFKQYFDLYFGENPKTLVEFRSRINKRESELRDFLDKKLSLRETPDQLPMFIWISDEREAIFAFETHGDERLHVDQQVTFSTRDKRLIDVLMGIVTAAERKAKARV